MSNYTHELGSKAAYDPREDLKIRESVRIDIPGACVNVPAQKITVAMAISQMGETVLNIEGAITRIDQSLLQPRPEKNGCDVGLGNREPTLPESICILEKRIRDVYERLDRLGMIVAEQLGGYKLE